jgi:Icc-related predicted phosphoesterase
MRILVVADVHGKFEILQKIMDDVEDEQFDMIIAPGDFTDMFDVPTNFSQMDVADIVIQKLMIPNKPLLCIPGNHDPYEILDVFEDYGTNMHNKTKEISDMVFVGWGGAATPFNTLFEPSEEETEEALNALLKNVSGNWVLVTHSPPKGTILDMVKDKHVGSAGVKKIIEKRQPVVAISAHIHENSGTDNVGKTPVFYPGPAYKGYYGFVEITNGKAECSVKRVNI